MSIHIPVLLEEVLEHLLAVEGATIVDGTLGGGGHTRALAQAVTPSGLVISMDQDPHAITAAREWDHPWSTCVRTTQANFAALPEVLDQMDVDQVDGVLLDLGLSSDQLADQSRGFSFQATGSLDLRFNPLQGEPAYRLLERLGEKHLADLIFRYGEERYSRRIARRIVESRQKASLRTAQQLRDLICQSVPAAAHAQRIHPATRTFQALRIAVNEELKSLEIALRRIPDRLRNGARLAIISFHSLEDRLVKHAFRSDDRLTVVTKRPIRPSEFESGQNPRSRSARLRVAERQ